MIVTYEKSNDLSFLDFNDWGLLFTENTNTDSLYDDKVNGDKDNSPDKDFISYLGKISKTLFLRIEKSSRIALIRVHLNLDWEDFSIYDQFLRFTSIWSKQKSYFR